jgi:uroporphyrinogen-III synthase
MPRRLNLASQGFHGLRVLSLESRRSSEIARLIATHHGVPFSAPAMREVPLAENQAALRFARDLVAGSIDMVVFLTGVGARALLKVIEGGKVQSPDQFLAALRRVTVAARGPKPLAVLREWNVPVALTAPEPCTWRELLRSLDELPGGLHAKRVAVQEYGAPNSEFLDALSERGAVVQGVAVYQWALPPDITPLRDAVSAVVNGQVRVVLFTTGVQVNHLFQIAAQMGRDEDLRAAFRDVLVASIGPSTSETLRSHGIRVDLEPAHPKMGFLVKEAAERSAQLLAGKGAIAS